MSTAHNKASLEDVAKVVLMPGDPLRAKLIDIQGLIKEKEFLSWEAEWEWQVWEFIRMNFLNSMMLMPLYELVVQEVILKDYQ